MNGLTGARVVVVDDNIEEAIPVIKELSKKGIPTVYFGSVKDLPADNQGLIGIRLAILDMDLIGGGVPDISKISTLLGYLKKILHKDNGPYGVLIWTHHVELQELFEEQVFNVPEVPNPVFVICIPKADCKDKKGNFKLNIVSSKLNKALKDFSPLLLLQKWEEASYRSATNVTNEIARLAIRDAADFNNWRNLWKEEILQLMHTLAVAEAGKQLDGNSSINSLYTSMNPLHSDRMESQIPLLRKSLSAYSAEIFNAQTPSDVKTKAKLNSMLHLSFEGIDSFYAGNIYTQSKLVARIPSVKKLLDDFADGKEEKKKKAIEELAPVSKSVVVEVNAVCDHSQKNIRITRFVAGLIVPEDKAKFIKGRVDFIYELGPVFLQSRGIPAGEYYLYFSARHLLSLVHPQVVKAKPFARLRGQAFADLQSWFAHRASRPGKLLLTKNL